MHSLPIDVKGRGRLRARADVTPDGVTVCIDDDARPEFWAELHLSTWDLSAICQAVELAEDQPGVLSGVFALEDQLPEPCSSDGDDGTPF